MDLVAFLLCLCLRFGQFSVQFVHVAFRSRNDRLSIVDLRLHTLRRFEHLTGDRIGDVVEKRPLNDRFELHAGVVHGERHRSIQAGNVHVRSSGQREVAIRLDHAFQTDFRSHHLSRPGNAKIRVARRDADVNDDVA